MSTATPSLEAQFGLQVAQVAWAIDQTSIRFGLHLTDQGWRRMPTAAGCNADASPPLERVKRQRLSGKDCSKRKLLAASRFRRLARAGESPAKWRCLDVELQSSNSTRSSNSHPL
jgi:hypothetical protein